MRFAGLALSSLLALASCGRELPAGGVAKAPIAGVRMTSKAEPLDVLPNDLDLVVRLDMKRLKNGVGAALFDDLARTTERASNEDDAIAAAVMCSDVAWVGLRLADLDTGDRVVVVEGKQCAPLLAKGDWRSGEQRVLGETVSVFDRADGAARTGTQRVIRFGERMVALVSPAELDSVARVLRDGPDDRHGEPSAEGIASLDLRSHGLPPRLSRRFPSIASVLAGVERVRAVATVAEDGLHLEAQIVCPSRPAADKVQRFLEAIRTTGEDTKVKLVLEKLVVETVETTVRVRWILPAAAIRAITAPPVPPPPKEPEKDR